MNTIRLNKKSFEELLAKAKYQFILRSNDCIYYIAIGKEVHYSDSNFVAHNETKKSIDIVSYDSIISGTIDGIKYTFKD